LIDTKKVKNIIASILLRRILYGRLLSREAELETQISVNFSTIIYTVVSIVISAFGFFVIRLVKGYDTQVKELYRSRDEQSTRIAKLETEIDWLKCELRDK